VRIIYNSTRCPPSPAIPISASAGRPLNSAPLAPYAFLSSIQPPTSSLQNLIVTPELEFCATRRKQNSSSISNRYKTGFWQASSSIQPLVSSLQNLIANPRLKSALSAKDSSDLQISNREPLAIFRCVQRFALLILLATSHSSLATRFPNRDTAINNRNIPHRFSHFQFSNRDRSGVSRPPRRDGGTRVNPCRSEDRRYERQNKKPRRANHRLGLVVRRSVLGLAQQVDEEAVGAGHAGGQFAEK